jgi:outer membrane protein assembly factor BamB
VIPAEQQRPALTVMGSRVYVAFGGLAGDCGTYHGFVVAMATNGVGSALVYKVPSSTEGAIWEVGGPVVASNGDLLVTTGNGASTTSFDGSDAVVEFSPTLQVHGVWAPTDWVARTTNDRDLGSGGVVQIPGTSWLFVAGKALSGPANGYLVHLGSLGHGPSAAPFTAPVCTGGDEGVFGPEAVAPVTVAAHSVPYVFVPCQGGTTALAVATSPSPSFTIAWHASGSTPNGPPVVAGGLVWAIDWSNDHLDALSPTTGATMFDRSLDQVAHFATPLVANGHVYVATRGGVEAFTVS